MDFKVASHVQILNELGRLTEQNRLAQNITQQNLANDAGVSLRTIQRLENGGNSSLETLVRVMIALGLQENLKMLFPDPIIQPMELIKEKPVQKKRARSGSKSKTPKSWEWGDS